MTEIGVRHKHKAAKKKNQKLLKKRKREKEKEMMKNWMPYPIMKKRFIIEGKKYIRIRIWYLTMEEWLELRPQHKAR